MNFPEDSECVCIDHFSEALYQRALHWIDGKKRVIFVSDFEKKSEDLRIIIYQLDSPIQREMILKKIAWSTVFQKIHIIGDESFQKSLKKYHLAAHLLLSEAAGYWVKELENTRKNQGLYRRGLGLANKFNQIPAIIVGAGPSLEDVNHLLKYFEKRALIFAAGSALKKLAVEPHFIASIDSETPKEQFFGHPFPNVPFLYQTRVNPENFSYMKGEKIIFPDSSSKLLNWLINEDSFFDGGWTVGNFLTQIALIAGCCPIIFVGMDLCYLKDRKYAFFQAEKGDHLLEVNGNLTQKDWLMAASWTYEKARESELINASGRGILELKKKSLKSLLKRLSFKRDLRSLVKQKIQELPEKISYRFDVWDQLIKKHQKSVENLEDGIVYQLLLAPLWQIWKPIFEREVEQNPNLKIEHHKWLFFQNVLGEHGSSIL